MRRVVLALLVLLACAPALAQDDDASLRRGMATLYAEGRYQEAIPLGKRLLALRERRLGPDHEETLEAAASLADLYRKMGLNTEAMPLYERRLATLERLYGPEDGRTAGALNDLGALHAQMGDPRAIELFERALALLRRTRGEEHIDTATAWFNVGLLRKAEGRYADAEAAFARSLSIREKALGSADPVTSATRSMMATLYQEMGDFARARSMLESALAAQERRLGREHPDTAGTLALLGQYHVAVGDPERGAALLEEAVRRLEARLGRDHASLVVPLQMLGAARHGQGDFRRAEAAYRRARDIAMRRLGPKHPTTAVVLNGTAILYSDLGDRVRAAEEYRLLREATEGATGPDSPNAAVLLHNLAFVYDRAGRGDEAEALMRRALAIWDVAAPRHPYHAGARISLASLLLARGRVGEAAALATEALAEVRERLGGDHPMAASALRILGRCAHSEGRLEEAERHFEDALDISARVAPDGPQRLGCEAELMRVALDKGDRAAAGRWAAEVSWDLGRVMANVLSFTSERQRLAVQRQLSPYYAPATMGDARAMADAVLRYKGLVLDSLLEDAELARAARDPALRALAERLRLARLAVGAADTGGTDSEQGRREREARREAARGRVEALESELARGVAGLGVARRALGASWPQAAGVLGSGTALVEYVRYERYAGGESGAGAMAESGPRYGAVVLGQGVEPRWVPLGDASRVEAAVRAYRRGVKGGGGARDLRLREAARDLYDLLWAPVVTALPAGTSRVVVSPDADTHLVSFATLIDAQGRFVAERWRLRYVASGRDLLRPRPKRSGALQVLFGNPDFRSAAAAGRAAVVGGEEQALLGLQSFGALPGTDAEVRGLARMARRARQPVEVHVGKDASERSLRAVRSPRVLHLATHGWFLPDRSVTAASSDIVAPPPDSSARPMHRSGLALSGAQRTLDQWRRGLSPPSDDDGLITAEDVAALDLGGTWLVTLSACETGLGDAAPSEGILGLRRGFVRAGARNLLMTLWSVADRETARMMVSVYQRIDRGENPADALADVQRAWLQRLRKTRGAAAAIRLAGPFIVSVQGR